jgi:hypothetical protein
MVVPSFPHCYQSLRVGLKLFSKITKELVTIFFSSRLYKQQGNLSGTLKEQKSRAAEEIANSNRS